MNGNRWVGTGHNTVFQDANGDWWTIYHAVDQEDPFFEFAPGFTKRPALLDAIDWVNGWPTVNGGSGPSDRTMPAPAGQEGEVSRHQNRLADAAGAAASSCPLLRRVRRQRRSTARGRGRPARTLRADRARSHERGAHRGRCSTADPYVDVNNACVLAP